MSRRWGVMIGGPRASNPCPHQWGSQLPNPPPLIVLAVSGVGGFAGVDISPFLLFPHPPLEVCARMVGVGVCWPLPLGGWYLPRAARVTCVIWWGVRS